MKGVSNIQDLNSWFFGHPGNFCYWTIYRGHIENKQGSRVIARNETENNKDDAWDMLESAIGIQSAGGGKFTILASSASKGNAGYTTFLTLVDPTKSAAVNGVTQNAGIYGANVDRLVAEERARTENMVHMSRDIEDLQGALEAKNKSQSAIGRVIDMAIEKPQEFGQMITGITQAVVMGIAAFRGPGPAPYVAGIPQTPPPAPPPASSGGGRNLEDSIEIIAQHFEPEEFLGMISKFVETNPQQAQMLFNQLLQQANGSD